ncbi:conserved repeat domain-containing protein [Sinosporangium album]|uniref:Conserved repeat domain-containing protein n=1 Tax=Sinosporangium album TaxID=504805 RepID=A0A1G7U5Z3_9ACTN|nr:DUF11 domain-containing protein [Sinosporangium album]SDG42691.1 conserved repeat domain-containing protein [Sinosporangium album]
MPSPLKKIASLVLAAPLAGAMALTAAPASATVTAPAAAATKATEPYSTFAVSVKAPKKVRAGSKITYRITAVNRGPHTADNYYVGGLLPKGIGSTVRWDGPEDTECEFEDNAFFCTSPYYAEVGDKEWLDIEVRLKKTTRGYARAQLGVVAYDFPTGSETLSKEELDAAGIKSWFFSKKVKTAITR